MKLFIKLLNKKSYLHLLLFFISRKSRIVFQEKNYTLFYTFLFFFFAHILILISSRFECCLKHKCFYFTVIYFFHQCYILKRICFFFNIFQFTSKQCDHINNTNTLEYFVQYFFFFCQLKIYKLNIFQKLESYLRVI